MKRKGVIFAVIVLFFLLVSCDGPESPKSVILMIGDGMGFEQQKAVSYFLYGEDNRLSFHTFPVKSWISTYSADSDITDSAASATAMATGVKVNNGVISRAIPGDGSDLETILERYKAQGKSTGIVTTTMVTHATPAAFVAHADSRGDYTKIAADLFTITKPNVVFGGGGEFFGIDTAVIEAQGYEVALSASEFELLEGDLVAGLFGSYYMPYEYDGLGDYPHLSDMVVKAVEMLEDDPDGFFLVIEGGRIDHACHSNDIVRTVFETVEFYKAVEAMVAWMDGRNDILLIVTADHETGGLEVIKNNGTGEMPDVMWTTTGHTGMAVPFYAKGFRSDLFITVDDNSKIKPVLDSL